MISETSKNRRMLVLGLDGATFDVLLDNRKERPGVMFADMELLGIPHRIVLSDKALDAGTVEYKGRRDEQSIDIPRDDILAYIRGKKR